MNQEGHREPRSQRHQTSANQKGNALEAPNFVSDTQLWIERRERVADSGGVFVRLRLGVTSAAGAGHRLGAI